MEKRLYATPEMVKNYRQSRMKKGSESELPDFIETLKMMEKDGVLSEEPLPIPVLDGHMSKKEFMAKYDRTPFDAVHIINAGKIKSRQKKQGAMFQDGRDVVCVQHIHDFGYREQPVPNFFAVTYMYRGKMKCIFEEKEITLYAGDILIVTPRFRHSIHTDPNTFAFEALIDEASFNILFGDFLATHSQMSDFFGNAVLTGEGNYCIIHGEEDDSELRFYLQSFANECFLNEVYSNTCAISLIKLFLSRAFRKYGQTMECYSINFHKRKIDASRIYKYISNNYTNVTLEQIAEYFHYNESYLSRYIKSHFNKSFSDLVAEFKINHAREYLKNTNKRISDIAVLVGYDSSDHFSRMFRKYTGMSPAQFRKHNGQDSPL